MLRLRDFRQNVKGLSDLLPYAALIDEGIILQKDGSFLAAYEFIGQDTASMTDEQLEFLVSQANVAVNQLETGYCLHVDAIRTYKQAYPDESLGFFPDKVTKLIDDERRKYFGSDVCFSTRKVISITYKPEMLMNKALNKDAASKKLLQDLKEFKNKISQVEDTLSKVLTLIKLAEREFEFDDTHAFMQSDLLSHINQCITNELQFVRVPEVPMYLDSILGNEDLIGGHELKIGSKYIKVISIDGFPQASYPVMLRCFESAPFELRFNTRFICLDRFHAEKEVESYIKEWNNQVVRLRDQFMRTVNPKLNKDALIMREDAEYVKAEIQSGRISAGYLSSTILIFDEDRDSLEYKAREIRKTLQSLGFTPRFEDVNAMEAYLGSLPGNTYANIRRPLMKTDNLADLLPLSTVYVGEECNPCPFYPDNSRALAVFTTDDTTPFWFNIHNGDIGHTLMFGPTGAGKSTCIGIIAAQFMGYENAQIFAFDKGNSLLPLCLGAGGSHYEIGVGEDLCFCPLQRVDESPAEMTFCEEWIGTLLELQGYKISPKAKNEIHEAMNDLANQPVNMRSITNFIYLVQDTDIKEALMQYSREGTYKNLVDADNDTLGLSKFIVFELEELMGMGDKILIPILTYIFHRIEKALKGQPSLLILDEAWIMLGHPVFRAKIREWLKVLRKANCAVLLATQSLTDAKDSGLMSVLVESCHTKILLPNAGMTDEQQKLYSELGLNETEIDIIKRAIPKKDYYLVTDYGRRLVQLALGKKTLSFIGASDKESIKRIKELRTQYGADNWQEHWLEERGAL